MGDEDGKNYEYAGGRAVMGLGCASIAGLLAYEVIDSVRDYYEIYRDTHTFTNGLDFIYSNGIDPLTTTMIVGTGLLLYCGLKDLGKATGWYNI